MKILHIINNLNTGGAQKLLESLLPVMACSNGVSLEVLVPEKCGIDIMANLRDKGIHVDTLGLKSALSVKAIQGIRRKLRDADIVHVHLFPSLYSAAIANIGINRPLIYTEHSTWNRRRSRKWLRPVERLVYSRYKAVTCISDAVRTGLESWIGKNAANRLSVIPNGVDLDKFHKTDHPFDEKQALRIFGRRGKPILMVSRFEAAKDQATVIRAMAHVAPEAYAVFAGDGSTLESMKALAETTGVADRTVFLGNRNDIPELAEASYMGVQSSNWEGFGLTALEIMAAGKPVAVSDVPGLRDIADSSLSFPKGDSGRLAEIINRLLKDKCEYSECANRAKTLSDSFDIHKTAEEFIRLYKNLS